MCNNKLFNCITLIMIEYVLCMSVKKKGYKAKTFTSEKVVCRVPRYGNKKLSDIVV